MWKQNINDVSSRYLVRRASRPVPTLPTYRNKLCTFLEGRECTPRTTENAIMLCGGLHAIPDQERRQHYLSSSRWRTPLLGNVEHLGCDTHHLGPRLCQWQRNTLRRHINHLVSTSPTQTLRPYAVSIIHKSKERQSLMQNSKCIKFEFSVIAQSPVYGLGYSGCLP